MTTWTSALAARNELQKYKDNRVLLFALALHENLDDVDLVASDSLTDGRNDKKCDLVYVNREAGRAIVAQGYWSTSAKSEAPSNKASDLNTAAAWLLSRDYKKMPASLQTAAEDLEAALDSKEITSIEFWYVHNLPESENVKNELSKVVATAESLLLRHFPKAKCESISAIEVGNGTLETWYRGTQAPILVNDTFSFETTGGFLSKGETWNAYSTSVPGAWLRQMFKDHGRSLFSANVRDYLGSRRSDKNINHNIKDTARTAPSMFWVYNNGVTALVHDFQYTSQDDVGILEIRGIAIVNGAQTTGALGSVEEEISLEGAHVPVRFVKCSDSRTVQSIIRFTNSQNKIEASDFRSNDAIQTRLRNEFLALAHFEYFGGRRGGDDDSIRRPKNVIPSSTAGQALMAFHGDPISAYNESGAIWQSDTLYSKVFNGRTSAHHLVFAYSLLKAVDDAKSELRGVEPQARTESQSRQWDAFRQRGATFLLTAALARSVEVVLGRPVPDRFRLRFVKDMTLAQAIDLWSVLIKVAAPLIGRLSVAFAGGSLKNRAKVQEAIDELVDVLTAVRESNPQPFERLAGEISQT